MLAGFDAKAVTPYGGVWIEMVPFWYRRLFASSRLMGACGLKFDRRNTAGVDLGHALWGRVD